MATELKRFTCGRCKQGKCTHQVTVIASGSDVHYKHTYFVRVKR